MITKTLLTNLTEDELRERGDKLAALVSEIDQVNEAKKASAKAYRDQLDELSDSALKLGREIRTKQAERDVECDERPDWTRRVATMVRTDTGEVVSERPLTPEEGQTGLLDRLGSEVAERMRAAGVAAEVTVNGKTTVVPGDPAGPITDEEHAEAMRAIAPDDDDDSDPTDKGLAF